jgi:tetratricopeptide (TPR) repeat protein
VVSLSDFAGKIVVIIYWRTGQDRSTMAIKDVQDILLRYKDKELQVLGLIADDENQEAVQQILIDNAIDFPVLIDPDRQVYGAYGIRVSPMTVIIDKGGKLAYDLPGHSLTYKSVLEGHVRYVLGEIDEKEMQEMVSPHNLRIEESVLQAHRQYELAMKFAEIRFFDQSMEAANKSIEAERNFAPSHTLLGFLYLEGNEINKAYKEFDIALELDPGSNDAKTGLGAVLIIQGRIDSAIELLNIAAATNPYLEITYYELGRAYELRGERDMALELYKKAAEKFIKKRILPSLISKCE